MFLTSLRNWVLRNPRRDVSIAWHAVVLSVSQNRRVNVSYKLAKLGFEKPKAAM